MIFSRQKLCWSEEGQEKLLKSSVLIAGTGGLGSLVSEVLMRAGVGKIHICDRGIIDTSDLNRQFLYNEGDIGKIKVDAAKNYLEKIHSYSKIIKENSDILSDEFIIPEVDIVIDCLDNLESRLTLWDKCPEKTLFIHGGVEDFFGQVGTFQKLQHHDFKKLYSGIRQLNDKIIPNRPDTVAVISSMMATEAINTMLNKGQLLGKLLVVDLSDYNFQTINLGKH